MTTTQNQEAIPRRLIELFMAQLWHVHNRGWLMLRDNQYSTFPPSSEKFSGNAYVSGFIEFTCYGKNFLVSETDYKDALKYLNDFQLHCLQKFYQSKPAKGDYMPGLQNHGDAYQACRILALPLGIHINAPLDLST